MNTIIPIASGKGGVGKTVFASNLGISLAGMGKTVILADLDLGGANLHTCLGVRNRNPGIGSYIYHKGSSLESLIMPTDHPGLFFIPGDSLLPGTANLPYFTKKKLMKELSAQVADYIILDLGSGSAYNTVDFFLMNSRGIIVSTPETTAILNAYSFLKTTLFRLLYLSFPPKSEERKCILEFVSEKIEGSDTSFSHLIGRLNALNTDSGELARQRQVSFHPRIVINRGKTAHDIDLGGKLREISRRNLNIGIEYIGFLPADEAVELSIIKRTPANLLAPASMYARNVDSVAKKIAGGLLPETPPLYDDDEDLQQMKSTAI